MNLEIYNMTISDLEKIQNSLLSDFDDFWTYSTFRSELENPNSFYFVAKLKDEIVGFGGIWKSVDALHITNIVTKKEKRNSGIASAILNKIIQFSIQWQYQELTLEVNANNLPAIHLYEKFGFTTLGIRKKYYNNREDAIIMTKYFKK